MDLPIRFCTTPSGARIAYATIGEGPPLVWCPKWISHLERLWAHPAFRTFIRTLAQHRTVILYDRYGCGLSDRDRTDFSAVADMAVLEALVDHLELARFTLVGVSASGPHAVAYAARHPQRLSHLICYGTWARFDEAARDLSDATRAMLREHWGVGWRLLTDRYIPRADEATHQWFAALQRDAATPEIADELRIAGLNSDVSGVAARIAIPTTVIHRRADLALPVDFGRQLAALIPGAEFVMLEGDNHLPWFGDAPSVLRAITAALGDPQPVATFAKSSGGNGLSKREAEVALLVARGLSNRQIGTALTISERTAEAHVAHILDKLAMSSRSQVAAWAAETGLLVQS